MEVTAGRQSARHGSVKPIVCVGGGGVTGEWQGVGEARKGIGPDPDAELPIAMK